MYSCDDNDDDADDDDIWTIWSPTLNTVPVYGSGVTSNFGPPRKETNWANKEDKRPRVHANCCVKNSYQNFGPPRPAGPPALRGLRGHYLRHWYTVNYTFKPFAYKFVKFFIAIHASSGKIHFSDKQK